MGCCRAPFTLSSRVEAWQSETGSLTLECAGKGRVSSSQVRGSTLGIGGEQAEWTGAVPLRAVTGACWLARRCLRDRDRKGRSRERHGRSPSPGPIYMTWRCLPRAKAIKPDVLIVFYAMNGFHDLRGLTDIPVRAMFVWNYLEWRPSRWLTRYKGHM